MSPLSKRVKKKNKQLNRVHFVNNFLPLLSLVRFLRLLYFSMNFSLKTFTCAVHELSSFKPVVYNFSLVINNTTTFESTLVQGD